MTYSSLPVGAGVRGTRQTLLLLRRGLEGADGALLAGVSRLVQELSGLASRQGAVLDVARAQARGGGVQGTSLAGSLYALGPVGARGTGLALAFDGQLLSRAALVSTLLARHGLAGSGGLAQSADLAREAALLGLVETVTAGSACTEVVVEVFAGTAAFLAVVLAAGSRSDRDRRSAGDRWTGVALELTRLGLVGAHRTRLAFL